MEIINSIIRCVAKDDTPRRREIEEDIEVTWNDDGDEDDLREIHEAQEEQDTVPASHYCIGCSNDPAGDLEGWHEKANRELHTIEEDSELPPIPSEHGGRTSSPIIYPDLESGGGSLVTGGESQRSPVPYNHSPSDQHSSQDTTNTNIEIDPTGDLEDSHGEIDMDLQTTQEDSDLPPISCISIGRISSDMVHPDVESGDARLDNRGLSQRNQVPNYMSPSDNSKRAETVRLKIESVPRPQGRDALFCGHERPRASPEKVQHDLIKMGLTTALAIMLHNFPEGIATFVAALGDTSVGAAMAIATTFHNVPEGMCVALPIYYATGNRWRAFGWGCLAGITEPIAALFGWLVLAKSMSDTVFAVVYGLVSGMTLMISLKEMIPTAHRYDPGDTVVTSSLFVGMGIMALSIVLFHI
jgi:zinc transporter ZupT